MKRDGKLNWFLDRYLELILGLTLFVIILVAAIYVIFYSDNNGELTICDYCNKIIETGVDDYIVTQKGEHYHADCYRYVLKEEKK
jgi:hypothetical protein